MALIDIVIPVYNREEFIGETLQSLLDQTNPNWNAYVVDDGSTDDSKEVVRGYAKQSEGRIKLYDRPDCHKPGGSGARNYGAALSKANWIMFLDSDDLLSVQALTQRVAFIKKYPIADMIVFPSAIFNKNIGDANLMWNALHSIESDLKRFLTWDIPWSVSGPVWKRKAFEQLGGFDEKALSWQDWELHVRAILLGLNIVKVEDSGANLHHFVRIDNKCLSVSKESSGISKIRNRVELFERIRTMASNNTGVDRLFFRMYFVEWAGLKNKDRHKEAELFYALQRKFPSWWRMFWKFNEAVVSLTQLELRLIGRYRLPKLINRFYNSRLGTFLFMKKGIRTFRTLPIRSLSQGSGTIL